MGNVNNSTQKCDTSVYMNRIFCSTKERVSYIINACASSFSLSEFRYDGSIFTKKLLALPSDKLGYAKATLIVYDFINDPLSAMIIDRMRSRWGKFKPFQYLALIPNLLLEIARILLPVFILSFNVGEKQTLWLYMAIAYAGETITAIVGGGGYINNVFTPNQKERAALLTAAKFAGEFCTKAPGQILTVIYDLVKNNYLAVDVIKAYVIVKSACVLISTVSNVHWAIVSKERIMQAEKPQQPIKGLVAAVKTRPLISYALSGIIDGVNVGSDSTMYYTDVLKFATMPSVAGIPGSPLSYLSYAIMPRLKSRFSTRGLWFLQRGSVFTSNIAFLLVGLIGGKKKGLYLRKLPMTITFALGNCLEMLFYATKQVVGTEIRYELQDYCEWQNGYRMEGTFNMVIDYMSKLRDIVLQAINGRIETNWAGFKPGMNVEQSATTKWRLFIAAFGPKLIFDAICLFPMIFYNIDRKTRDRMYAELEQRRAVSAIMTESRIKIESEAD